MTLLAMRSLQSLFILSIASAVFAADAPSGDPQSLRFEISGYAVDGATLLTAAEIQEAVAPFVGKDKDFSDVQRALEAVEAVYARRGYTAVQVSLPEQELEKGRVRFRVVESRFGNVTVKGQKYFSEVSARNALPSVRSGDAPRSKKIASELNLANQNPARQLNVVLRAGKKEDLVDADILVADKNPSAWGMSFDNSGTTETGHTRLGLSYSNANVLNADHVGTMQLQVSPQQMSRVRVFGAGYKIPLYSLGDSVEFFGGYSNVNSVVGGLTNFQGGGTLLNARYNQTLDRIAGFDPHLYYGFDWRSFRRIEQTKPASMVLYNEITVTPFTLGYAAKGRSERSTTSLDLNLSANVLKTSKGKQADFAAYDPLGMLKPDANYRIVHYDASHVQSLGSDWQARGALTGQWTRNVLILGEQIRLGGMNGVRGFSEGSEAGESGVRGTLELYTPEMQSGGIKNRALVFFDGGNVHSRSGVRSSITSAGLGLRSDWQQVSFRVDAGRIGKAGLDPLQKAGDWRIHAALSAMF